LPVFDVHDASYIKGALVSDAILMILFKFAAHHSANYIYPPASTWGVFPKGIVG